MVTLLIIILIIYIFSRKPHIFHHFTNDDYMHIDRTRFINGLFITLVLISHIYISFQGTENHLILSDLFFEQQVVRKIGQLMVVPFFFFSGYGIMYSFENKIGYSTSITKRLICLLLNFNIAITLYVGLNILVDESFSSKLNCLSYIKTAIGYSNIGNQNWFIFATLALYLFCIISFNLLKNKHRLIKPAITLFSLIYMYILSYYKTYIWIDTILCFSAGLYLYSYRERLDTKLRNIKLPKWILGIAFILFSQGTRYLILQFRVDNKLDFFPALGANIASIIFALGILLLFSCIKLEKKPTFLILMGGKYLFPIYILHMLPIILLKYYNLHTIAPNIYILAVIVITLFLSLIMQKAFNKVNNIIR